MPRSISPIRLPIRPIIRRRNALLAAGLRYALLAAAFLLSAAAVGQQTSGAPPAQQNESVSAYRARRETLRQKLAGGWVVLFGTMQGEGSEAYWGFHQESNFYYLTGYTGPNAILLLAPAGPAAQSADEILFLPARNPNDEVWTGPEPDPHDPATAGRLGVGAVRDASELAATLHAWSKSGKSSPVVYTLLAGPEQTAEEQALAGEHAEQLRKMLPRADLRDIRKPLAGLRQVKSYTELQQIRRAVDCSVDAHLAVGRAVSPGLFEYQIAALFKYTVENEGCTVTGFVPIVGAGPHSVFLHYTRADGRMRDGDLLVVDAAGEYNDYSADITRTFPVNGHFTARQREIYNIVLGAQKAVIAAIKPGMTMYGPGRSLHQIAYEYLNTHGKDREGQPLGKYFPHGIGHSVGLDVHDPTEDPSIPLQPGMVLAIEPGLYIPEENIGVRIEDDVVVTQSGCELLSSRLPREAGEVERWMQQDRSR